MIVTEEEAKTKRCQESYGDGWTVPDGRMATAASASMVALVGSPSFCIGSACMAWRWRDTAIEAAYLRAMPTEGNRKDYLASGYEVDPDNKGYLRRLERNPRAATGYCGKAGKP